MAKCVYCKNVATGMDAVGLPACQDHQNEADDYYESITGRDPNEDSFEFCPEHGDFWLAGCERCETCSQHHYGMSIAEANQAGVFDIQVLSFGSEGADGEPQSFHFSHGEDE